MSCRLVAAVVGCSLLAVPGLASGQPRSFDPALVRQIEALLAEKEARTPAERKLDSRLLYARRMARGLPPAPGVGNLRTGVTADHDGLVPVDIRADVTPLLLSAIADLGGELVRAVPQLSLTAEADSSEVADEY